ncbi:MAG TPA: LLM class F420-dependent oxidoreductase [Streptosporangiaceae bacterium]|nr:LLM class F420-dependent oxidoreductase [Streptosporangiaceae bacterium]
MKLAIQYASFSYPGGAASLASTLAATARAADEGGCSRLALIDHWFQMESLGGPLEPMLEGYTTLGYLAAVTSRLRLGLLVTGVTYRHPGLLAKQVATLDVLSGGRAFLGIGAAWYEREHRGLGVPFPPLPERFERLEETLQICQQMWSDDQGPYDGQHYQLAETICQPQPLASPRPLVLIGGGGEKKTLRLVAEYADACNLVATSPEEVAHRIDVLSRHCAALDRDPATVEKTIIGQFDVLGDPDGFLRAMEAYAGLGVTTVWMGPTGDDPAASISRITETVGQRLAAL